MYYDYKNHKEENNNLRALIIMKLNSSSSNRLKADELYEIINELWYKTRKNKERCISIINTFKSSMEKTQDFKRQSIKYINELSETGLPKNTINKPSSSDFNEPNKTINSANNKPSLSDFKAPNISIKTLEASAQKYRINPTETKLMFILWPIIALITIYVAAVNEGQFEFWMILAGFLAGFFVVAPIIWLVNNINPTTNDDKDNLRKLEAQIYNRRMYEIAIRDWEYINLVTQEGYWLSTKGIPLENSVKILSENKDWNTKTTSTVGDGGVDLICTKENKKVFIQCKGHSKPLGVSAIRDAAGVKMAHKPDEMIVVAPNGFTKGSIDFANQSGVILIDSEDLVRIANNNRDFCKV